MALNAENGEAVWKTERDELPSWGTPTVATTAAGPELVTNASKFVRGYDPRKGQELWRLGGSSKISAPTPIFADGLFVVASGRAPERPIFVIKPGSRGDLTLRNGETSSAAVVWSRTGRGSYMPTPLVHEGVLYELANNGDFDAYDLKTGEETYRQRLDPIGSGFSASPVVADNKIPVERGRGDSRRRRWSCIQASHNELDGRPADGDPRVVGRVMYVRTASSLFAVGPE
jgi:outer membrane protein assembly factor BamB